MTTDYQYPRVKSAPAPRTTDEPDPLIESRQVVGWLENAFLWLLENGDVDNAQAVFGVVARMGADREGALQGLLTDAQDATSRQLMGTG
jgi:hypothetical protein